MINNFATNNRIAIICIFLMVATLMAFWQVKQFDFVRWDDHVYITENNHIQNGLTVDGIRWSFTSGYAANWHPLTWISHMLDVQLFGLNPQGHHLTNLLFHIANTVLLFLILHRMTKATWQSAFVAALFALHPLHVESVAWVTERKDVLSTFFWMLTLQAYCFYVERPRRWRYLSVLVLFALGLMAKPMLVTLPFVLLLLDYWPLRRIDPIRDDHAILTTAEDSKYRWALIRPLLWEKIPLFALTALSIVATFMAQQEGGAVIPIEAFPLIFRIENASVSYIAYIEKMIWPTNLTFFYPYPVLPDMRPLWQVLGSALVLIVITVLVIRAAKRSRYLIVGWLWYFGALLPVIGLVQVGVQARADRYAYIPLIGLFIMAAWGIPELLGKWNYRKKVLIASSILTLASFFVLTWIQVGYWQNTFTLCDHALKVTDNNIRIYLVRGSAYAALGNYKQAIEDYDKVIETNPINALAYLSRAKAYRFLGNYKRAIADSEMAIAIVPKYAAAYSNRAAAYGNLGDFRKAIEDSNKSIEINPKDASAYFTRAAINNRIGNQKQEIADMKSAALLGDNEAQNILRSKGINW